jgi:glucosamine--fructose-6-phosphate aminotransferase (isomerizing)
MCGIFAFVFQNHQLSTSELVDVILQGLKRLEYRGYDSSGVCFDVGENSQPVIIKKKGNVSVLSQHVAEFMKSCSAGKLNCGAGIAHTRWATHGEPNDLNAHPIASDDNNEFVIVHNGIVNNYSELKRFLITKGNVFHTQTDTEVIAKLAKYIFDSNSGSKRMTFPQLVMLVMAEIDGAFGLVFKSTKHFPGELVGCRRGSPLVVGMKRSNENALEEPTTPRGPFDVFMASDASAIVEHTRRVLYLEDEDVVHVSCAGMQIYNRLRNENYEKLKKELRPMDSLEMELAGIMKGGYDHYMLKEIMEQPESIVNSMRGRVDFESGTVVLGGLRKYVGAFLKARRIVFIACGTSYHACLAVRAAFEDLCDVPVSVDSANDFMDRRPPIFRDDVTVFVSQSGETADTMRALEYCKEFGSILVGFTNVVGSSLSRSTEVGAHINAGPEIGVASTKAYTSQIVTMLLLALMIGSDRKSKAARREAIIRELQRLPQLVKETLLLDSKVKALAETLKDERSLLVMGRGYNLATCLEAALKIKELAYIHTEGIHAGDLKHGPLALVDENLPILTLATRDSVYEKMKSAIQQVRARRGRPIVITTGEDPEITPYAECILQVPQTVDCLQCIINIIPLQLLAYHTAVLRGQNVDCPRNLAKSVTTQ